MGKLGYCVVFDHGEQGWQGLVVIVTDDDLDKAIRLTELISGYPKDHERYKQDIFDLTELYHKLALNIEGTDKILDDLKSYSPEAYYSVTHASHVTYTVQAFTPLGTRAWINRKWDLIKETLHNYFEETKVTYRRRKETEHH